MQKRIVFDIHSVLRLARHYLEGEIPADAEVENAGFSGHGFRKEGGEYHTGMNWCGMMVKGSWGEVPKSLESDGPTPLYVYYDGCRVESFDQKGSPVRVRERNEFEAPRFKG